MARVIRLDHFGTYVEQQDGEADKRAAQCWILTHCLNQLAQLTLGSFRLAGKWVRMLLAPMLGHSKRPLAQAIKLNRQTSQRALRRMITARARWQHLQRSQQPAICRAGHWRRWFRLHRYNPKQ
jgi:hypothetical protein